MPNYVLIEGVFTPVTYTLGEIDNMFSAVPISRFGDMTTDPVPYLINGTGPTAKITIIGNVPLFLAGRRYNLTDADIPIGSASATQFYLYAKLTEGVLGILVSKTMLDETLTQMYVGTAVISDNGSAIVKMEKVTRIDIYRLSSTPRGTAIPVSTGSPYLTGSYLW